MFVGVVIFFTSVAKGIIEFALVGDELMGDAILTKSVQHAVNGNPVHFALYFLFQGVLAKGRLRLFQQLKNELFRRRVSPVHGLQL